MENCINHIEETSAKTLRKSEWPAFNLINITEVLLDKKSLVGREFSDLDVSSVLNRKLSTKTTAWKRINCSLDSGFFVHMVFLVYSKNPVNFLKQKVINASSLKIEPLCAIIRGLYCFTPDTISIVRKILLRVKSSITL